MKSKDEIIRMLGSIMYIIDITMEPEEMMYEMVRASALMEVLEDDVPEAWRKKYDMWLTQDDVANRDNI